MAKEYDWVETTEHIILEFGSGLGTTETWQNNIDQGIQLVGLDNDEVFLKAGNTVFRGFYEDGAMCEDLIFTIQGDIPAGPDEEEGPLYARQTSSARAAAGNDDDDGDLGNGPPTDNRLAMESYDEDAIDATLELVGIATKKIIMEKVVLDINNPVIAAESGLFSTQTVPAVQNQEGGARAGDEDNDATDEAADAATVPSTTDGEGTTSEMDIDRQ